MDELRADALPLRLDDVVRIAQNAKRIAMAAVCVGEDSQHVGSVLNRCHISSLSQVEFRASIDDLAECRRAPAAGQLSPRQ